MNIRELGNKKYNLLFITIVILQIVVLIYYGYRKGGLFIDEIWTFNLANSYHIPFLHEIDKFVNSWLEQSFWLDRLTVVSEHKFSYENVFRNQALDVHPPFYYVVIHTLCSFFSGEVSKWMGIVPNIIFFIIAQIFIYRISQKIFNDNLLSILPVFIYGFSLGGISSVLIIRMYMMLTCISIIAFYIHCNMIEDNNYKYYIICFIVYTVGILTRYYFIVFGFFLSLCYVMYCILSGMYGCAIRYIVIVCSSIPASVAIFPSIIEHIFNGYRGKEAVRNLKDTDFIDRLEKFFNILNKETYIGVIILVSLLIVILYVARKYFDISTNNGILNISRKANLVHNNVLLSIDIKRFLIILFAFLVSISTIFVITKIAAFITNRYILFVYPLIIIVGCFIVGNTVLKFLPENWNRFLILASIIISICGINIKTDKITWIFKKDVEMFEKLSESNSPDEFIAVIGNNNWWPTVQMVKFFAVKSRTFITYENELNIPSDIKDCFVYVARTCKNKNVVKEVAEDICASSIKEVYKDWHGNIYKVTK